MNERDISWGTGFSGIKVAENGKLIRENKIEIQLVKKSVKNTGREIKTFSGDFFGVASNLASNTLFLFYKNGVFFQPSLKYS